MLSSRGASLSLNAGADGPRLPKLPTRVSGSSGTVAVIDVELLVDAGVGAGPGGGRGFNCTPLTAVVESDEVALVAAEAGTTAAACILRR